MSLAQWLMVAAGILIMLAAVWSFVKEPKKKDWVDEEMRRINEESEETHKKWMTAQATPYPWQPLLDLTSVNDNELLFHYHHVVHNEVDRDIIKAELVKRGLVIGEADISTLDEPTFNGRTK